MIQSVNRAKDQEMDLANITLMPLSVMYADSFVFQHENPQNHPPNGHQDPIRHYRISRRSRLFKS